MEIKSTYNLYELIEQQKPIDYKSIICENMKNFRLKKYNEFKQKNTGVTNPYSTDSISEILGISKVHYKRLENKNDKSKNINVEKLLILSIIYNKKLDDFLYNSTEIKEKSKI